MISKRMKTAVLTGSILGIFCIIGVGLRFSYTNYTFLVAMWFNRFLMGVVIGLAEGRRDENPIYRGLILGFLVSGAIYLSTEFKDLTGFLAGIGYGLIIDYIATRYEYEKRNRY
jgi:hypothetical protein